MVPNDHRDLRSEIPGTHLPQKLLQAVVLLRNENSQPLQTLRKHDSKIHLEQLREVPKGLEQRLRAWTLELHAHEEPRRNVMRAVLIGMNDIRALPEQKVGN